MHNAINHGVAETFCSGSRLIIEMIFFLLGYEWDKVCICFIDIRFFATGFECFSEKYGCMHVVVAGTKKLTVIDYFIAFFCKLFSIIELLEEVSDWCEWIPTCGHAIKIGCEIGGGDGSILSVYTRKTSKRFTLTKLGDTMFESGRVLFWIFVSDHGD